MLLIVYIKCGAYETICLNSIILCNHVCNELCRETQM